MKTHLQDLQNLKLANKIGEEATNTNLWLRKFSFDNVNFFLAGKQPEKKSELRKVEDEFKEEDESLRKLLLDKVIKSLKEIKNIAPEIELAQSLTPFTFIQDVLNMGIFKQENQREIHIDLSDEDWNSLEINTHESDNNIFMTINYQGFRIFDLHSGNEIGYIPGPFSITFKLIYKNEYDEKGEKTNAEWGYEFSELETTNAIVDRIFHGELIDEDEILKYTNQKVINSLQGFCNDYEQHLIELIDEERLKILEAYQKQVDALNIHIYELENDELKDSAKKLKNHFKTVIHEIETEPVNHASFIRNYNSVRELMKGVKFKTIRNLDPNDELAEANLKLVLDPKEHLDELKLILVSEASNYESFDTKRLDVIAKKYLALKELQDHLQQRNLTEFKKALTKNEEIIKSEHDEGGVKLVYLAGHAIASLLTGGIYFAARTIHSKVTRDTWQFWRSHSDLFKEKSKSELAKINLEENKLEPIPDGKQEKL